MFFEIGRAESGRIKLTYYANLRRPIRSSRLSAIPSTSHLSVPEKLALMVQLWSELSRNPSDISFPQWQRKELGFHWPQPNLR